jgi:cytochrome P450
VGSNPSARPHARIGAAACPAHGTLAAGRDARLVTRYADVRLVLSDRRFSRSAYTAGPLFARSTESLPLTTTDGPEHSRRRAAVARAFTPASGPRVAPGG